MLTPEGLARNRWRLSVDTFAERVSRGSWEPYPWISTVLRTIQKGIAKGGARFIVNAPPRHGKSEGLSHWLAAWFLDWHPRKRVIVGSYGDTYAEKFGLAIRDAFASDSETWTRVRRDRSSVNDWITEEGGGLRTAGVGGAITGYGGDLIVLDDPHKNLEEAFSPVFQKKTFDWFTSGLLTRAEPGASVVVHMARWNPEDLSGRLLADHGDDWTLIKLPAISEDEDDFLGRGIGEALCPERFSTEALEAIRKTQGSFLFNSLYQQRPAPLAGNIVKREWFRFYRELPSRIDDWIQSWDLTFGDTGTSFVVGQVWIRSGANCYLVDQVRVKINFPETIKRIKMLSSTYPETTRKLVEKKANGAALIDTLENEIPGLIGINPSGSKENRLVAVSGGIEAGNVYLPDPSTALWVEDFIAEVVGFPGRTTDQVDTMTQALKDLFETTAEGLVKFSIPSEGLRPNPWKEFN